MNIPDKHYYTIGDVSRITGTKPHILRYWESQFKLLRPARRYSGHRKFSQREIELINRIRYLIFERKFTLAGAKREITKELNAKAKGLTPRSPEAKTPAATPMPQILQDVQKDIEDCIQLLRPEPVQKELVGL